VGVFTLKKHTYHFGEPSFRGFSLYIEDDRELNKKGITSSVSKMIEKSPLVLEQLKYISKG